MRRWRYRIALKKAWKAAKNGELSTEELAKTAGRRIRYLLTTNPKLDCTLIDDIAFDLENFSGDDTEEFDYTWDRLYNWADHHDVWVETVL